MNYEKNMLGDAEVILRLTDKQHEEWSKAAKEKNVSLQNFIIDCVEGKFVRSELIRYLKSQAAQKPWWEKRTYIL